MLLNHFVFLGDVVSSRHVENRDEFHSRLQQACARASELYEHSLYAKIRLIKGTDELGAVFSSWKDTFDIINLILDEIHPHHVRFSVVKGLIDVAEETRDVSQMDGPAFHQASSAINELRENGLLFQMASGDPLVDLAISNQISMLLLLRQRWTARQHQIVMMYRADQTQREIATAMAISQQEVSRLLRQINWKQYRLMEDSLKKQIALHFTGGR